MMLLLTFRKNIQAVLQKYHVAVVPFIKFLQGLIMMYSLQGIFGYHTVLSRFYIVIGVAALCAIFPSGFLVFMFGVIATIDLLKVSIEVAAMFAVMYVIMYLLYMRFSPKHSYLIILSPLLFMLHLGYLLPLLAAMFVGVLGIVPVICGTIIYYFSLYVKEAMTISTVATGDTKLQAYKYILEGILKDKNLLLSMVIFAIVVVVTYFIYRLSIDYSWYIAIGAGTIVNILGFLLGSYALETEILVGGLFFGSIVAFAIAVIVQFFKCVVDYTRIENVQFEDDNYYYYVKAIPKIDVPARDISVKKINSRRVKR